MDVNRLERRPGFNIYIVITVFFIMLYHLPQIIDAEEARAIEISGELSITECYPDDTLWVNGTAHYDNSTPVNDSEVLIQIMENEMKWKTFTDLNGDYKKQITATGRFIDQSQPEVPVPSGYTGRIDSIKRIGQTFKPNVSEIQSIDIYIVKSSPLPSSSLILHIKTSPGSTTDLDNVTLSCEEIKDGWNNFAFQSPLEVVPGNEYFILLTSNTTAGYYKNYGRPWGGGTDYKDGIIYWEGDPMEPDPQQDMGFFTYYDAPLTPGEYTINVSIIGANSTVILYGYNESILRVIQADLYLSNDNLSLIYSNDSPLEGDEIVVNMTVQNLGDAPALNFLLNFSIDNENNVFTTQSLSLNAYQMHIMSTVWVAQRGNHTILVNADSSDIIFESLETNNNASIQIFVDGDNDHDGIGNLSDDDDDNDGYPDVMEIEEETDPLKASSKPADNDGDFIPDSTDLDDDNDGWSDTIESLVGTDPFDDSLFPDDFDKDGIPDSLDPDTDNDGVLNNEDMLPYNSSEWIDTDFDGVGNNADNDDDNDGMTDDDDAFPLDTDNDGLNNDIDWDDDADGIFDWEDDFPLDTDNDGLTNDVDDDDDGDGLSDSAEEKKHTNPLKSDTDGDGVNDKADYDPLDSGVTSEPGFPMIYLLVPTVILLIFILFAFLASRRGGKIKATGVGESYKELPAFEEKYDVSVEPQPSEEFITHSEESVGTVSDELDGIEEEFEEL